LIRFPCLPACLVSLLAVACAHAQPAWAEGLRYRVVVEAPSPYAALLEKGLTLMRWRDDTQMTRGLLEQLVIDARTEATRAMAAEGHFSATVESEITEGTPEWTVRLAVIPGPLTRVESVEIRFRGAVLARDAGDARRNAVRRGWPLQPGNPFRQVDWEAAKLLALAELSRVDYLSAAISVSQASVDPEKRTARLSLELDSGPPFRLGPMQVRGLVRHDESIVMNLNLLAPGDPFDADRVAQFERRLVESGYFAGARVNIDPDPAHAGAAPVVVVVVESRRRRIDAGVSYSTDSEFGGRVEYFERNLFERQWRLRVDAQADSTLRKIGFNIDLPPRADQTWLFNETAIQRTTIQGQRSDSAYTGFGLNWGEERLPSTAFGAYVFDRQQVSGAPEATSKALYFGYRRVYRKTDDAFRPRSGVLGSAEIGTSVPGASTRSFQRATLMVNGFIPAAREVDVNLRCQLGAVFAGASDGIPTMFLFRTGGDQTVRGYAFDAIGVQQGTAVVGGRYLGVVSAEATWWFLGDYGAAVFVDAGDAVDDLGAFSLKAGIGVGMRWRSPIGPFRVDVAYGEATRSTRLHLSVGYVF
jgi:translocation and assembly module TamA